MDRKSILTSCHSERWLKWPKILHKQVRGKTGSETSGKRGRKGELRRGFVQKRPAPGTRLKPLRSAAAIRNRFVKLTSLSGCPLQVPPERRQRRAEKRWSYICPSFCLHQNSAWGERTTVRSRSDEPQIDLNWVREARAEEQIWEAPHQMCLIGSGVCRMATRDPPWFRKKMLYSSWKICRREPAFAFSSGDIMQKHTSARQIRGTWERFQRADVSDEPMAQISGFICIINKSCTYFAKGWLSNHLCFTSLLLRWRTEEQKLKVGVEGWVRFLLLFTYSFRFFFFFRYIRRGFFFPLSLSLSQAEGEVQRKENIYYFRNRYAIKRNNAVEAWSGVGVKWSRNVTSLQVFPASDVMKMLTLVLVSSPPTTPECREGPTLVIPIISKDKTNQRGFAEMLFLRQKGRWRGTDVKERLIWFHFVGGEQ